MVMAEQGAGRACRVAVGVLAPVHERDLAERLAAVLAARLARCWYVVPGEVQDLGPRPSEATTMSPFGAARTLGRRVLAGWHWLSRGLARIFSRTIRSGRSAGSRASPRSQRNR